MSKLIVALDNITITQACELARSLRGLVWGFKVNDLAVQHGMTIVRDLKHYGNVFVDLKVYDIPNTVANSVRRMDEAGADMISVHASGGDEMLTAARQNAKRSLVVGITVLSSTSDRMISNLYSSIRPHIINKLVASCQRCYLDGIVCSAHDLGNLKAVKLLKVVPGIRPNGPVINDDQKFVSDGAINADYLVVGRPVVQAEDPLDIVKQLNRKIDEAPSK